MFATKEAWICALRYWSLSSTELASLEAKNYRSATQATKKTMLLLYSFHLFSHRHNPFKMSANFSRFFILTPLPSAVFYYYPSANLANFWPLPPKKNTDVLNGWSHNHFIYHVVARFLHYHLTGWINFITKLKICVLRVLATLQPKFSLSHCR